MPEATDSITLVIKADKCRKSSTHGFSTIQFPNESFLLLTPYDICSATILFHLIQHPHSFPFAFSKASIPSVMEKYASPAAPMASAYANPVSSYIRLDASKTNDI